MRKHYNRSGLNFERVLFGSCLKGIPDCYHNGSGSLGPDKHGVDVPYCFNRKEAQNRTVKEGAT